MCGINGLFAYHPAAQPGTERELLKTRERMHARGPDGCGAWWNASRRCGLGHRRLSIVDLSERAAQPMVSGDGNRIVTFNGEIYNYPTLRKGFEADGVRFASTSDTEALLHLYARHGAEMVHQLRGMFAFAIWDERKCGLFLARDPYGIKPLYTADDGRTFRFASQVKALLAGEQVSREIDPAGVVGFYLFGSVPEPFTLYRAIRALPAGHTQWIDAAGPHPPQRYVTLAEIVQRGMDDPSPRAALSERLRDCAADSVKAHLLADVEVGIFLSAGVDSGALLGLMRDAGQRDIRAITLAFDEFRATEEDEAPHAARIAARYEAHHVVRRVGEREFSHDLPAIFDAMDQPSIDGVNTWFIAKAAREAGLKVALSGIGGDELLAGYPSFVDVPRWRRRYGALAKIPGFGGLARSLVRTLAPEFARRRPKALGIFEYCSTWAGAYLLRRGLFLPDELFSILDPELVDEGLRRLNPTHQLAASIVPDPGSDPGRVCLFESSHYLRNQLLRDADWAGMAHSLEIRVPLVDIELLKRFAPALGTLVPGEGKAALARSPTLPLPEETVARAKTGFGVPTGAWMAKSLAHKAPARAVSAPAGLISRDWSQIVLPNVIAANENIPIEAVAS
ncbi:MAG: asparagine synthase (glutamine-hydrolyzing) [Xanthobacteraceae bacterium]